MFGRKQTLFNKLLLCCRFAMYVDDCNVLGKKKIATKPNGLNKTGRQNFFYFLNLI